MEYILVERLGLMLHIHSVVFHAAFSALKLRRNTAVMNRKNTDFRSSMCRRQYFNVTEEGANEKERRNERKLKMSIHNVLSVWCKPMYVPYDLDHKYVLRIFM